MPAAIDVVCIKKLQCTYRQYAKKKEVLKSFMSSSFWYDMTTNKGNLTGANKAANQSILNPSYNAGPPEVNNYYGADIDIANPSGNNAAYASNVFVDAYPSNYTSGPGVIS